MVGLTEHPVFKLGANKTILNNTGCTFAGICRHDGRVQNNVKHLFSADKRPDKNIGIIPLLVRKRGKEASEVADTFRVTVLILKKAGI